MAVVRRVRRLVNPRVRRKRNSGGGGMRKRRRKLTPAQIAAGFGGKRRQAAATHRRRKAKANPTRRRRRNASAAVPRKRRVRVVYRTRTKYKTRTRTIVKRVRARKANPQRKHRRRRRTNPLLVTLGPALNPRRRRSKNPVAKRRKRRMNPRRRVHHRVHHRRRNPVRVVYRTRGRRRRANPGRRRKRNPISFGNGAGIKNTAIAVVAGLAGVTVTKLAASAASSFTASSPILNVVVSGVAAWGAGELAKMALGKDIGHAVAFGGYMQAGSVALNAFLPSIGSVIGLSGLRGLTPSNDILLPYNMFAGRGAMLSAGSPAAGATRSPGGGTGFTPAFA